ncbi:MAG: IS630 family transposase [Clostridia bacterium]|nr:IS630 family transposase [Clostridia bacterium]
MENELKSDALNIGSKGQHDLRKTIIRMLKDGKKGREIAKDLGVSVGHVSNVKKLYEAGGASALKPKKRGRPAGKNKVLSPEQEKGIQKIIVDKTPEQMRFKECMWTRNNIRQLIKEKYDIDIKLSTLGYYLARWGFTVQRPVKRAYKQDEKKIDEWLNSEFPGITERAEKEDAEIFFGDETNIQNTANYARGYAPKGQTPVVRVEAQKLKIEMLSAISKRGKLRFMLYKDSMNSEKLIDFMTRLITDSKKKVFLVLDNLRVHHAKLVQAWVKEHEDRIELFFLPPYSPEYNPDELLNSDIKRNAGVKQSPRTQAELEANVQNRLDYLVATPAIITSFFHAPFTQYAA